MNRFILLFLCACGGGQTANVAHSGPPTTESTAVDPLALPPGAEDDAPEVELISAGEDEPQLLRLRTPEGFSQRLEMSMQLSMQMTIGPNASPPVDIPVTHMVFAIRVTATNADGLSRRELLLEEVRVDPGPLTEAMEAEVMPLRGMTGVEIVDARGRSLFLQYDLPEGVPPATRQNIERMQDAMKQVQPPFPIEPVAVGARWRVTSQIRSQMVMDQIQDFELVEREGERVVLRITTTQSAEPQVMEVPQPGVSARLLDLHGEATGTTTIFLDQAAPTAEVEASIRVESEITQEGQPAVPMTMVTQVRTQTAPR